MPELPEVETIRRLTETHLVGHDICSFTITLPKLLRQSVITDASSLQGKTVLASGRRGKILDLSLSDHLHLLVHFKLAGQLALQLPDGHRLVAGHPVPKPGGEYPHKATHATMTFDDGRLVWFSDIRQFGWFNIAPSKEVPTILEGLNLGPEATEPIDSERIAAIFSRRAVAIKAVLLDQRVLAGLGNIYVDEALFAAGIHPSRSAKSLSEQEIGLLLSVIPGVLEEGIRQGGATIIHGKAYPDNEFPAVHGREGESCFRCGAVIEKSRVAGRGTYICPVCQPFG